jgi:hypothetical protein
LCELNVPRYDIKDVKAISKFVGTRTPTQVRTHAQKWLLKQVTELTFNCPKLRQKREWKMMQQQQQQQQAAQQAQQAQQQQGQQSTVPSTKQQPIHIQPRKLVGGGKFPQSAPPPGTVLGFFERALNLLGFYFVNSLFCLRYFLGGMSDSLDFLNLYLLLCRIEGF